jgi:TIR domain-containing protein
MAQVFLSYARRDLPTLQPLLQDLGVHGITVWRDQDNIYGGQQWPKAIGEAIAAHDVLLLVWSQEAAASHFVEFEWNTALALQKSILPCLLDQTPLPPALRAINGIDARRPHEALPKILHALQQPVTPPRAEQSARVITTLGGITATDPAEVVQTAKAMFMQQGWHVQGNVYQAARDIHVTLAPQPAGSWLEKWQTWVVFLTVLLSLITVALVLPTRIRETFTSTSATTEVLQTLSGRITDERQEPLADVEVFVPEFNLTASTNRHGVFTLQVRAIPQRSVELVARKGGYITYTAKDATLGNHFFNFTMRREK